MPLYDVVSYIFTNPNSVLFIESELGLAFIVFFILELITAIVGYYKIYQKVSLIPFGTSAYKFFEYIMLLLGVVVVSNTFPPLSWLKSISFMITLLYQISEIVRNLRNSDSTVWRVWNTILAIINSRSGVNIYLQSEDRKKDEEDKNS